MSHAPAYAPAGPAHHHPTFGPGLYAGIFAVLLGLTGLTVVLADAELGSFHVPVALAIAGTKAALVVLFFMHGLQSGRLIWLVVLGGLLFLAILLGLTFADYATRGQKWLPETGVPPPARPAAQLRGTE